MHPPPPRPGLVSGLQPRPHPSPQLRSPRPAPEPPPLPARPSYLCPRSGRLLVPRPQSPFDPLLGSEPCDPVGGPRSPAASAARLSCWVSPPLPLFLAAAHRRRGALRCPAAPRRPGGRAGAAPPRGPPHAPRRWDRLRVPGSERGAAGVRSPRGAQILGRGAEARASCGLRAGLRAASAPSVNTWPAAECPGPPGGGAFSGARFPFARGCPDF